MWEKRTPEARGGEPALGMSALRTALTGLGPGSLSLSVWPKIVVGGALGKKPLLTCGGHAAGGHPWLTDLCS